ncbi:class F sortase [Cellulosimicrobium sp. Marseille-Q4280]|uniref:class F sortase n=1 Tax=Cellulosimicrobium sp. Marseille-Q4280 TaxID=2937992 RepID=UPI002040F20A|nr:class F sortase [Cellulosimicrobium sp. Marseille-Q4280]
MRSRHATALATLAVGAALLVGGCAPAPADETAAGGHVPAAEAPARPAPGGGTGGADAATSGPVPDVPVRPARDQPAEAPPAATRVVVPSIGLDMAVEPAGVDGEGQMALPDDARSAAWYRFGPGPASPEGAVVVAAHVDDLDGAGPFARLPEVAAGTTVDVVDATGTTYTYTVNGVEDIAKADLPLDVVFDRGGPPRLVLVTCGGEWDRERRSYTENVVVTAERTGGA